MMEIIWHILLTVCLGSSCIEQDVQWFETEEECFKMLNIFETIPPDGDWETIQYQCKPLNSIST